MDRQHGKQVKGGKAAAKHAAAKQHLAQRNLASKLADDEWLNKIKPAETPPPAPVGGSVDFEFLWETSDEMGVTTRIPGGVRYYNRSYGSDMMTKTGFGHWMGWTDGQDAIDVIFAEARKVSDDRAATYAATYIQPVRNLSHPEETLFTLSIGNVRVSVLLWSEALNIRIGDKGRSSIAFLWMPRLTWRYLTEKPGKFIEVGRYPFYADLYDRLPDGHSALPKRSIIAELRRRSQWRPGALTLTSSILPRAESRGSFPAALPVDVLREIMCWLDLEDVLSFSRASSWAYSVAIDNSVWCWHCAKRLNLEVLPQLMKRITKTDYRRLWMLLNNALSLTIVRDPFDADSPNQAEFVVELKVGSLKEIRRSVFPQYMFAPERAKE